VRGLVFIETNVIFLLLLLVAMEGVLFQAHGGDGGSCHCSPIFLKISGKSCRLSLWFDFEGRRSPINNRHHQKIRDNLGEFKSLCICKNLLGI